MRAMKALVIILGVWLMLAYVILPLVWRHYEHNPALADAPKTTVTAQGIPGDPLNVGLIGDEDDVVLAMHAAGWSPADPITLASCLRIAASVVFKRPDPDAPGERPVSLRPSPGPGVREAGRRQCPPPSSRAVLEMGRCGPCGAAALDWSRDL